MIRRWPLLSYFALACGISWLLWLPRIASEQGWTGWFVPEWWHYAGAAGPIAAALLVAGRTEGRGGFRGLLSQFDPRRVPGGWLLFAIVSPVALFGLGAVVLWIVEGRWPTYQDVAKTANLPTLGLPLTFLVHVATFGIGEETGWRGFALPRLQARHSAVVATLILTAGWAIWHVPSFFGNPGYANLGPVTLIGWSIGLMLGALFLTWLYNSARGSLLAVVLWHGLFNAFITSQAAEGLIAAVMTTGVMLLAVIAIVVAGPRDLRGLSRRTGPRRRHDAASQKADTREAA